MKKNFWPLVAALLFVLSAPALAQESPPPETPAPMEPKPLYKVVKVEDQILVIFEPSGRNTTYRLKLTSTSSTELTASSGPVLSLNGRPMTEGRGKEVRLFSGETIIATVNFDDLVKAAVEYSPPKAEAPKVESLNDVIVRELEEAVAKMERPFDFVHSAIIFRFPAFEAVRDAGLQKVRDSAVAAFKQTEEYTSLQSEKSRLESEVAELELRKDPLRTELERVNDSSEFSVQLREVLLAVEPVVHGFADKLENLFTSIETKAVTDFMSDDPEYNKRRRLWDLVVKPDVTPEKLSGLLKEVEQDAAADVIGKWLEKAPEKESEQAAAEGAASSNEPTAEVTSETTTKLTAVREKINKWHTWGLEASVWVSRISEKSYEAPSLPEFKDPNTEGEGLAFLIRESKLLNDFYKWGLEVRAYIEQESAIRNYEVPKQFQLSDDDRRDLRALRRP